MLTTAGLTGVDLVAVVASGDVFELVFELLTLRLGFFCTGVLTCATGVFEGDTEVFTEVLFVSPETVPSACNCNTSESDMDPTDVFGVTDGDLIMIQWKR